MNIRRYFDLLSELLNLLTLSVVELLSMVKFQSVIPTAFEKK